MKNNPKVNPSPEINAKNKFDNNNNNKEIPPELNADRPIHPNENYQNYLSKNNNTNNTNNNNQINLNNYNINTTNSNDYNNVDPSIIKELEKLSKNSPKLDLEIINSLTLEKGLIISINTLGMISNSKRNANDGNTFFGFVSENEEDINKKVDFLIKPRDDNFEQRIIGRHFIIRFDIHKLCYLIKDLGHGYGTFMKINEECILKDNYLINIGNSYIVCIFGVEDFEEDGEISNAEKILNIKVFSENPQNNTFFYNPSQIKKIFIGRDMLCNIIVDDTLLSRIHCTIEYDEQKGWIIYDGKKDDSDFENNKPSTNGTWLYLVEETKIKNGMIFKSNQNIYECHLKD